MDFLPIFVDLKRRDCLVVGGGSVAARKVALLRKAQGNVTVVAPRLCDELEHLAKEGAIAHRARAFQDEDVEGKVIVIAATDDGSVNKRIAELVRDRGVPVNVVDQPDLCTFIMPSMIDRSPVQIAISTGGASPVLARLLRSKLETYIPAAYGKLGALVENFRQKVKDVFPSTKERQRFWEQVLQGRVAELVFAGKEQAAAAALQQVIEQADRGPIKMGEVFLVGAGPGDPDLLTFRALRLMQLADVVVYDRLVSPQILELVRRDAEPIYVGKERDKHTVPQEGINELLVRLAKEGKRVLRLKGGDPFIFGRGGEEIETLMEQGVPFQVVPGITAAAGCASYAGIPLTHRDYSQACVFVTGHLKDGSVNLNWRALAHPNQTIVFYMGLHGVEKICDGLISHGLPASTPAALVQQGTTHNQRVYAGTLESLPDLVKQHEVKPPTLIIVGDVVRLHDKLAWFEPVADVIAQDMEEVLHSRPTDD